VKAFAVVLLTLACQAQAAPYVLDAEHSRLGFAYRQMGVPMKGEFRRIDARLDYDPRQPERSILTLSADIASIDAGHPDADAEALKPAFFDAARHPRASFASTSVRMDAPQRATVAGKLTLKGRTRTLTLPVTLLRTPDGGLRMNGTLALRRLDFGIGEGEWADTSLLDDTVQAGFSLLFIPDGGKASQ
jgi:polyisoprenoid-binding protein YceI